MALFHPFTAYTPRRHLFPGRCPGLVYDTPLGSFDDAANHTYQGPGLPADSDTHPREGKSSPIVDKRTRRDYKARGLSCGRPSGPIESTAITGAGL
jgi:hypothetical protein